MLQRSYQQPITVEFQRSYADVVLELSKLNKDLGDYLVGVHQFCQEVCPLAHHFFTLFNNCWLIPLHGWEEGSFSLLVQQRRFVASPTSVPILLGSVAFTLVCVNCIPLNSVL